VAGRSEDRRAGGSRRSDRRSPAGGLLLADIPEVATTVLILETTVLVIGSWTPQWGLRVAERE